MTMNSASIETPSSRLKSETLILLMLFLAAFLIRLVGLDHGAILGDERFNEAAKVLTGQLVPDQHFYPPLMNYFTAVLYGALYAFGRVFGVWADTAAFRAQYFNDPTVFILVGRGFVGALGALMTPIAYRIGRQLGFSRIESLVPAAFLALAPTSVYLSYIYKGDVPMATAGLLTVMLLIRKWQRPTAWRLDIYLGIAMVLGLSFKHSFLFLMIPLFLSFLLVLWPHLGVRNGALALLRVVITGVVLWPILNIGIVLDLENFLQFQKIQTVMSITDGASLGQALKMMLSILTDPMKGLGVIMPLLFIAFPWLAVRGEQPRHMIALWVAIIAGICLVAYLVKLRQPSQLWISFFVCVQLFAALSFVHLIRHIKQIGWGVTVAALALSLYGVVQIWQQTLATPIAQRIATEIETNHADRKVMTGVPLPLQRSRAAQDFELAQVQRTADKYNIVLPPLAQERLIPHDLAEAYFVVPVPAVMFGLEDATEEELEGKVTAFAWPPQQQDWTLNNWIADEVDLFVISNLPYLTTETPSPMLRAFYQDVAARCVLLKRFAPQKPLFLERETVLMDCRPQE